MARARKREILLREPDAGKLHVRFDEREVETEQGRASEAPAHERAGRIGPPKPPRHFSTLLSLTYKAMLDFMTKKPCGVFRKSDGPYYYSDRDLWVHTAPMAPFGEHSQSPEEVTAYLLK